jgi:hypothetical protein
VTTRPSGIGEADAVLVTVAAPTKPNRRPARRHLQWRHTRSVAVTLDGAQHQVRRFDLPGEPAEVCAASTLGALDALIDALDQ